VLQAAGLRARFLLLPCSAFSPLPTRFLTASTRFLGAAAGFLLATHSLPPAFLRATSRFLADPLAPEDIL